MAGVPVENRSWHRPWPLTALSLLLLVQALASAMIGGAKLGLPGFDWLRPAVNPLNAVTGLGLLLIAPVALVAAVGFLRLWRPAWLLGMSLQGLGLIVILTLYFYFTVKSGYIYAGMAYHVFTVLYLNSNAVQIAFRVREEDEDLTPELSSRPTGSCSAGSSRSSGTPKGRSSSRWRWSPTSGRAACGASGPARSRCAWSRRAG